MLYLKYISIYLFVGLIIMVILDIMHKMVEDVIDDEFKEGYTNWERIYIMVMWPVFTYSLISQIIKDKQN